MARSRELSCIPEGQHNGSVIWQEGKGIEQRTRYADGIKIEITPKWAFLHLRDGGEIVRLFVNRNKSAQVFLGMTLREVFKEKTINSVMTRSGRCCSDYIGQGAIYPPGLDLVIDDRWYCTDPRRFRFEGPRLPCRVHTPAWLEEQIQNRFGSIITDEEWPIVLAKRREDAAAEQAAKPKKATERAEAKKNGFGEWKNVGGGWFIAVSAGERGDTVLVRTRKGKTTAHLLGEKIGAGLFRDGGEAPRAAGTPSGIHLVARTAARTLPPTKSVGVLRVVGGRTKRG